MRYGALCLLLPLGLLPLASSLDDAPGGRPVTSLHASQITAVMALGDSFIAGLGARFGHDGSSPPAPPPAATAASLPMIEDRGVSFATGMDAGATTLASLLEAFGSATIASGAIRGGSVGSRIASLCLPALDWCPPEALAHAPSIDACNGALSGATSASLPAQLAYVRRQAAALKDSPANPWLWTREHGVAPVAEWRLLTLFVGMNDICHHACRSRTRLAANFRRHVMAALREIRETLPQTLVNILLLPDASKIARLVNGEAGRARCITSRLGLLRALCPCAARGAPEDLALMQQAVRRFNEILLDTVRLVAPTAAFAITISPILRDTDVSQDVPTSFTSSLDCFHPSQLGQANLAKAIWRDLFRAPHERPTRMAVAEGDEVPLYQPSPTDRIQVS